MGDEGSGYWIAMRAMSAVLQARDGRLGETLLAQAVLEHYGLADELELVFRASHGLAREDAEAGVGVGPDSGSESPPGGAGSEGGLRFRQGVPGRALRRDEVAGLCPVVADAAARGDPVALGILQDAGIELGRLGAAVIRRLQMEQEEFAVVPFGGVFRIGKPVLDSFCEAILATAPRAAVVQPRFEPVAGAVLLALHEIGVEIDAEVIAAIEQSAGDFPQVRNLPDGEGGRLAVECAKLDLHAEQALAEEDMEMEQAEWLEY